jgi:transcriptional regulator with XRE-family HTH domain
MESLFRENPSSDPAARVGVCRRNFCLYLCAPNCLRGHCPRFLRAPNSPSAGVTQKELAEKIGVTRTMVTDYECGQVRLYDEILARLALVLECSADMILGLKPVSKIDSSPQLKFTRRIKELEQLPEIKQKAILKTLDDLIRANQ